MKRLLKILPIALVIVLSLFVLTACVDADHVVQNEKMTGLNYVQHDITQTANYDKCQTAYMYAIKNNYGNIIKYVEVVYFANDYDAEAFERDYYEIALAKIKNDNPEVADDYTYQRVGKIFIFGTTDGVADALS